MDTLIKWGIYLAIAVAVVGGIYWAATSILGHLEERGRAKGYAEAVAIWTPKFEAAENRANVCVAANLSLQSDVAGLRKAVADQTKAINLWNAQRAENERRSMAMLQAAREREAKDKPQRDKLLALVADSSKEPGNCEDADALMGADIKSHAGNGAR